MRQHPPACRGYPSDARSPVHRNAPVNDGYTWLGFTLPRASTRPAKQRSPAMRHPRAHCTPLVRPRIIPQDQAVLDLRSTIRALRDDVRALAGALHAISQPGADIPELLRALPPSLVQDALRAGVAGSAPAGDGGRCGAGRTAGRRGLLQSANAACGRAVRVRAGSTGECLLY
jgi:hypothetical protein